MTDQETGEPVTDGRGSLVKGGALGLGVVGAAAAFTGASAQEGEEALVFSDKYWPQTPFVVINQIQTSTTVDILNGIDDEGIAEISQPDEFNGYVVNYRMTEEGPGMYTTIFTEGSLQRDERYQFSGDAQMFSTELNLLETTIEAPGGDDGDAGNEETTPEQEETTAEPAETTAEENETEAVVVGTTTTQT